MMKRSRIISNILKGFAKGIMQREITLALWIFGGRENLLHLLDQLVPLGEGLQIVQIRIGTVQLGV